MQSTTAKKTGGERAPNMRRRASENARTAAGQRGSAAAGQHGSTAAGLTAGQHGSAAAGQHGLASWANSLGQAAGQHCVGQRGSTAARYRGSMAAQQRGSTADRQGIRAARTHARTHARTNTLHRGSIAAQQRGARTAAQQRGIVAAWQRGSRQHGMARWAHLTGAGGRAARQRSSGPEELCVILTLLPVSLRTGGSVFRGYWALCLSVCLCVGGLDRPRGFCRVCKGGPQSAIMAFLG